MEILPRFFEENTYGILTNSDIEHLYYSTKSKIDSSTILPSTYKNSESSMGNETNNEIDCTVHIEVDSPQKVLSFKL